MKLKTVRELASFGNKHELQRRRKLERDSRRQDKDEPKGHRQTQAPKTDGYGRVLDSKGAPVPTKTKVRTSSNGARPNRGSGRPKRLAKQGMLKRHRN